MADFARELGCALALETGLVTSVGVGLEVGEMASDEGPFAWPQAETTRRISPSQSVFMPATTLAHRLSFSRRPAA